MGLLGPGIAKAMGWKRDGSTMSQGSMNFGDEVTIARPDVAEILGIWLKATGRIVGIHATSDRPATVDVKFDGHETLQRYLPTLFKRVD